jgi:hypothetical protein
MHATRILLAVFCKLIYPQYLLVPGVVDTQTYKSYGRSSLICVLYKPNIPPVSIVHCIKRLYLASWVRPSPTDTTLTNRRLRSPSCCRQIRVNWIHQVVVLTLESKGTSGRSCRWASVHIRSQGIVAIARRMLLMAFTSSPLYQ